MDNIAAVMLCAGRGTRMLPLTKTRPKPLQEVLGKNLIEWKLEALPNEATDVVIVVGHMGEQIVEAIGNKWKNRNIQYVIQKELNGTGGALLSARPLLGERFLVMMGDDIYGKDDIANLLKYDWAIGVAEVRQKEMGGEMLMNGEGDFAGIVEEKHFVEHGFVNTGLYVLSREILDITPVPIGGSSKEFGLPHALAEIAKTTPVKLVQTNGWLQITTQEDLSRTERTLRAQSERF